MRLVSGLTYIYDKQRTLVSAGLMLVAAIGVGYVGVHLLRPSSAATTTGWTWQMSNIHGGGTAQVIATDPAHAGYATVGGDSWGVYNTTTSGNDWLPAMKGLGLANNFDVYSGDFFFMGMAYSHKYPGRVYALTGKLGSTNAGGFGYSEGDAYTVVTRSVSGAESTGPCGDRTVRPRCTGNRVLVDYDSASGTEYIYIAEGNGGGVARSTDEGKTWTTVGMKGTAGITGMAFDPADHTVIYAGTRANGAFKVSNIRASGATTPLPSAPTRVEELATIGSSVYAAADTSGVYKLSNGGSTWTKLGGSFFDATTEWAAIGGAGNTIYVGGAFLATGHTIGKSTDGGATWRWVPAAASNISITPWGTSDQWWLAKAVPRVVFGCFNGGCTYETTSIAVDQMNPNIVYSAGRSGVWKSEDGGANWRPAVNHLAGTMHNNVAAGTGGQASTDDVDWTNEMTSDNWQTVQQGSNTALGSASLSITKGGHTYAVQLTVPRDITMDGQSIADEYFKAGVQRPTDIDVSSDGNYIYIAQSGGGVMVGHKGGCTTSCNPDNPPTVSLTAPVDGATVSPGASVTLTAVASDDHGVTKVDFSVDGTVVSSDTSRPYTATWTAPPAAGRHTIVATATDTAGQTATATSTVTVGSAGCTTTHPAGPYGIVTGNFPIQAGTYKVWSRLQVSDATNNSYDLVLGDACTFNKTIATGTTGSWIWVAADTNLTTADGTMAYTMYGMHNGVNVDRVILAADLSCLPQGNGDNCFTTGPDTPPSVTLDAVPNPASGTVPLSATASDDHGVVKVDFAYKLSTDTTWTIISSATVPPYTASWDTSHLSNGTYELHATAFDTSGQRTDAAQTVTVSNTAQPPDTPPSVTLDAVPNPASGTVPLSATASDDHGVVKVDFAYKRSTDTIWTIITSSSAPPYTASWYTRTLPNGTYSLHATAFDTAGQRTDATQTVTVSNTPPPGGDADGDGRVNQIDYSIWFNGDLRADFNHNGGTDSSDLAIILGNWTW